MLNEDPARIGAKRIAKISLPEAESKEEAELKLDKKEKNNRNP
jgi:hypothetical protein